jgi:hypothetical protein
MTINHNASHFVGKPIIDWPPQSADQDASQIVYRIRVSWQEEEEGKTWIEKFAECLESPGIEQTTGIVIGSWGPAFDGEGSADQVIEALVTSRNQLPNLVGIFFGDITYEENEISWIEQTNVAPLLNAYPNLRHFRVRGGNGLGFGRLKHGKLQSLIVESGGLNTTTVREVAAADLPELEHLELWLGTPDYGGNATVDDLGPILAGQVFPKLKTLGLRDSAIADQIAQAVAQSPILERIQCLDLSLGTLSDEGALALLDSPAVARLKALDIHHHYCTDDVIKKLENLGIALDASKAQATEEYDGEIWRYVAVGE